MRIQIHIPWWAVGMMATVAVLGGLIFLSSLVQTPDNRPILAAAAVLIGWLFSVEAAHQSGREAGQKNDATE